MFTLHVKSHYGYMTAEDYLRTLAGVDDLNWLPLVVDYLACPAFIKATYSGFGDTNKQHLAAFRGPRGVLLFDAYPHLHGAFPLGLKTINH